jgi:hypothetical protein
MGHCRRLMAVVKVFFLMKPEKKVPVMPKRDSIACKKNKDQTFLYVVASILVD